MVATVRSNLVSNGPGIVVRVESVASAIIGNRGLNVGNCLSVNLVSAVGSLLIGFMKTTIFSAVN